jgi:preprotein translocase subunit Sec63
LHWLWDPSEINGDNLNNRRREASRHFRNKKTEYLKDKINDFATNSKNKNVRDLYRGINELNGATNLEITQSNLRMVICLQIPTTL